MSMIVLAVVFLYLAGFLLLLLLSLAGFLLLLYNYLCFFSCHRVVSAMLRLKRLWLVPVSKWWLAAV